MRAAPATTGGGRGLRSERRDKTVATAARSRKDVFMRLRPWLIASLGLNAILASAWYIAHIQEGRPSVIYAPSPGLTAPIIKTNSVVRYVNITWTQIASSNLAAYIANLQAMGCPKETIRDIILAEVNQSFARSRATEILTPDQQWWRTEPDAAVAREAAAELRQLENARRATLVTLLASVCGANWETETDVSAWVPSNYGLTGPHLGALSPEIKRLLYDLAAHTQDQMAGQTPAEVTRIVQNERTRLQSLLTPVALNEYLLRYSPTAAQLRADTRGVNYSPQQFQDLFAAVDPILLQSDYYYRGGDADAQGRQRALQAQYDDALQKALGSDTFHALRLNQDPLYASTTAAAQQTGLSAQNTSKLYDINRATQTELDRIRNDATLSPDDKIDALAETRAEQQRAIQQLLGPEAFQRWLQTQR
jgi:hypothetical protein